MNPSELISYLFLVAIGFFLMQGASNWALEQHHARVAAKYRRQEAMHRAQVWEKVAGPEAEEISLVIKKGPDSGR